MSTDRTDPEASSADEQPAFAYPRFLQSLAIVIGIVIVGGAVAICGVVVENYDLYGTGWLIMGIGLVWGLSCIVAGREAIRFYEARYGPKAKPGTTPTTRTDERRDP